MEPYEFIEGHDKVLAWFGQWPSFHDGEVHRLVLDRIRLSNTGSYIPTVEVHIRGWIMTSEVTEGGFYKVINDSVVHFVFEDIFDFEIEGFNNQNVLSSLSLSLILDPKNNDQALHVELEHCFRFSGNFNARRARILKVTPYVDHADA